MEPNVSYHVVHATYRRERETQATALQEDTAYNVNEKSPTQTDEDTEYSLIEYIGRERHTTTDTNIAYTARENSTNSVLDNKSNTRRIRQGLAKKECAKKWLAILAII